MCDEKRGVDGDPVGRAGDGGATFLFFCARFPSYEISVDKDPGLEPSFSLSVAVVAGYHDVPRASAAILIPLLVVFKLVLKKIKNGTID